MPKPKTCRVCEAPIKPRRREGDDYRNTYCAAYCYNYANGYTLYRSLPARVKEALRKRRARLRRQAPIVGHDNGVPIRRVGSNTSWTLYPY